MTTVDTLDLILLHRVADGDFVWDGTGFLYRGVPVDRDATELLYRLWRDEVVLFNMLAASSDVRLTAVGELAVVQGEQR